MVAPLNMGTFRIINAAAPVAATDVALKSTVDAAVSPGFVMAYAMNVSAPTGWLVCNGASLSTVTYSNLFAIIGYSYGGSGANFNVPDLRGMFLRGFDNGRGADFQGSRAAGVYQPSYLINHNHAVSDPSHAHSISDPSHTHTAATGGHSHSITDPQHAHGSVIIPTGSGAFGLGVNNPQYTTGFSAASGTGISINAVGNIGVGVNGAFTGINNTLNANTGVLVSSVSTGNVNFSGIGETTVQNYPVLWCIKF